MEDWSSYCIRTHNVLGIFFSCTRVHRYSNYFKKNNLTRVGSVHTAVHTKLNYLFENSMCYSTYYGSRRGRSLKTPSPVVVRFLACVYVQWHAQGGFVFPVKCIVACNRGRGLKPKMSNVWCIISFERWKKRVNEFWISTGKPIFGRAMGRIQSGWAFYFYKHSKRSYRAIVKRNTAHSSVAFK